MKTKYFSLLVLSLVILWSSCEKDDTEENTSNPDPQVACPEPVDLGHSPFAYGIGFHWDDEADPMAKYYQVEYGAQGYELGTGTVINTNEEYTNQVSMAEGQVYDFYVRSYCGSEDGWSEWAGPRSYLCEDDQYLCTLPSNVFATIVDNSIGQPVGAEFTWNRNGEWFWQTTVVADGASPEDGQFFDVDGSTVFYNLTQNTDYDFYVRAKCIDDTFTEWVGPKNINIGD